MILNKSSHGTNSRYRKEKKIWEGERLTENYKIEKIWSEKSEKITVVVLKPTDDESEIGF